MNRQVAVACVLMMAVALGCGEPPRPQVPALTPQTAYQLLQYNNRAKNWMIYVRKQNATCQYRLDLPDQASHPVEIDLTHIVWCGGRPSTMEFDASVSFVYDPAQQAWTIRRFSS
jgi:hypothetical protein